ncbi:type II toxin-antitoxin system VapC family toxin [Kitasatospora sp. NPDC051853]|uniref:type II toxin-antitoxin system VapC family toxin n=1 Tax=Kitasatospora sp. NPDC051853 TaxID=3364058 RepID=UPI0037AC174D
MIYLDSCALVKLVREEAESSALRRFLDEHADLESVTSELARTEVVRVVRRANHDPHGRLTVAQEAFAAQLAEARAVLAEVDQVTIGPELLDRAGAIEAPYLRTLDAVHLASALALGLGLRWFVTYDKGLRSAAEAIGLAVVSPA